MRSGKAGPLIRSKPFSLESSFGIQRKLNTMKPRHTAHLAALAGTCLAALPARTLAQCSTCPPGAIIENEPQCSPPDVVNGGCNYTPVLYGHIVPGQTICGKTWSTGQTRDTDWYYLYLTEQTSVTITGKADFVSELSFSQAFIQGMCSTVSGFSRYTAACGNISWTVTLPPGALWLGIAPDFGPVVPCGTPYTITLSLTGSNSCCLPSGSCQALSTAACTSAGGIFRQGIPCGNCAQPAGVWNEQTDAGKVIDTAQVTMGTGPLNTISGTVPEGLGDGDLYAIRICNPAGFSASTSGPGTLDDTQLYLFRIDGTGIVFNDDNPSGGTTRSRLSSAFTSSLPVGVYYLGVSGYDMDPVDSSYAEIWLDQPYTTERAPDGPGAANAVYHFDGTISLSGTYTVTLTGACYAAPPGWTEVNDAAEIFTGSQPIIGSGVLESISGRISVDTDADLFEFRLCQPQIFTAETITGPGTLTDTQLFLFRPTGTGIVFNDDDPQLSGGVRSRLSSAFTSGLPVGHYYLGVSGYDRDPVNASAQQLWLDTPYAVERAPDGPGAASPFAVWATNAGERGTYVVRLTGACYRPPPCYANCDQSASIPYLTANDFQCFTNAFAAGLSYANCDGTTGNPSLTANDFLCYINAYVAGCPN
jgi:hypothetical protein